MNEKIQDFILLGIGVLVMSILLSYLVFAWTEPSQAPPQGNVPTPINVGPQGQAKQGGLILNTGGAPTGLIVQYGNVGIGTTNPTQKLDVAGYVKETGLCIGSDCRTSWPSVPIIDLYYIGWVETNGQITIADSICRSYGYDGVWAAEDLNGTEPVICYKATQGIIIRRNNY
jgi:hypothetical protein